MSGGDHQTLGSARRSHYLDLIDLYAARATLAHTRDTRDPALPTVVLVGRSATIGRKVATHSHGLLRSRRWRVATASIAVLVLCLFIASSAFANQQYHVQEGDTITSVGEKFGADPVAILAASGLDDPEYLYTGQELAIPGTADAGSGTGFIIGTYAVVSGDTISSIAWDLHVNATDLLAVNGLSANDMIFPGQVLYVPEDKASRTETLAQLDAQEGTAVSGESEADSGQAALDSAASADLPPDAAFWVPTYVQQRNLSCEYAATYIATAKFGPGIPEWMFWDQIPVTSNPHYGYRGNIDGAWGNYDDYGIYPEALVPVLNANGFGAEVFYGDYDPTELMRQLALSRPVVVWLAMWGNTGVAYDDEGTYTVFAGEHVMTAYGYDQGGVYLSDPASGATRYIDWGTFLWMWGASDGMSLAVYPN